MSHIFYCHNFISFCLIEKIIKEKQLNKDQYIVLTKNFSPLDSKLNIVKCNSYILKTRILFPITWFLWREQIKGFKELIKPYTQNEFHFYTTGYSTWFIKYLINHKNSTNYSFIEEGVSAHYTETEYLTYLKSSKFKLRKRLFQILHFVNHFGYFYLSGRKSMKVISNSHSVFSLNENAYHHSNVIVLKDVFQPLSIDFDYDLIFVPSALYGASSTKSINFDNLIESYKELFSIFEEKKYYNILIQYHPRQNEVVKEEIRKIVKNNNKMNVLVVSNVSIERLSATKKSIVVSDISSLLVYANMSGCDTYSYNNLLEKRDDIYADLLKYLPYSLVKTLKAIEKLPILK